MTKKTTASSELQTPIERLQAEISDYEAEIQKLQHQLTELRPSPPPPADATPSEIASSLLAGGMELEQLRSRSQSIQSAIAHLEKILSPKRELLAELQREQKKDAAFVKIEVGRERFRDLARRIAKANQETLKLFEEIPSIEAEFGESFRYFNNEPDDDYGRFCQILHAVHLPQIKEQQGRFFVGFESVDLRAAAKAEALAAATAIAAEQEAYRKTQYERIQKQRETDSNSAKREKLQAKLNEYRNDLEGAETAKRDWLALSPTNSAGQIDVRVSALNLKIQELEAELAKLSEAE